jgi:hypothetical protein
MSCFKTILDCLIHVSRHSHLYIWCFIGLSSVVDQLACSFMAIACITTMPDQICPASCKPHFSLATWPVFVTVSSSCLAVLGSVLPCSLSATSTVQSSASRKSYGLPYVQWVGCLPFFEYTLIEDNSACLYWWRWSYNVPCYRKSHSWLGKLVLGSQELYATLGGWWHVPWRTSVITLFL